MNGNCQYNFLWTLGTVIQKLTEQVGKSLSNHGNKNKPAGGINVAQAFIKKEEVKELKVFTFNSHYYFFK